ncbi:MAG TPA: hypothetical protein VMB47_01005 [Candidatus Aquilonibacter sp.]|nr:hypothetical protein [Candidatus Aquilonibacter sp.]
MKEFVSWGAGDKAGADFATRFQSLSANGIPLSLYRLVLQCADHGLFGPFWVSVDRSDESVAIGLWLHKGSYFTGGLPRLTVSTAPVSSSDNAGEQLKMLPVFVTDEKTETEPVNASGTSEFYDITPGTYVLVLVRDGRTLCANAVNVFGWQARLALTENASGCTVTPIENVTIYQH